MTAPQEKDWAVMTATEQVIIDENRRAQVTFTVTNLQREAARVTTTVVADDVAAHWFALDQPVRYVNPGDSTQVQVRVTVPESAPAADYSFQLLAYSADTAPEERPTYSSRVLLRVPARPVRPRRLTPILLLAGVAVVVASLVTTLAVVLATRDGEPEALATPAPSVPPVVRVPSVHGLTDVATIDATLAEAGLVADVRYVHSTQASGVVGQEPGALEEVTPGSEVVVHYAVRLNAPTNLSTTVTLDPARVPAYDRVPARVAADVEISWQQPEDFVRSWLVVFASNLCTSDLLMVSPRVTDAIVVGTTTVRVTRHFTPGRPGLPIRVFSCNRVPEIVYVMPLDDLGQPGPSAETQLVTEPFPYVG